MNSEESISAEELKQFVVDGIERGWLEPVFDDRGAIVMAPVPDEDNPIWQAHVQEINSAVESLMEKGLVEIYGLNSEGEMLYGLTEKYQELYGA